MFIYFTILFELCAGCKNEDFQKHVPECISKFTLVFCLQPSMLLNKAYISSSALLFFFLLAGRLSYKVNPEKKELSINVTENLEGHNYIIRLCHAKDLICVGTSYRDMRVVSPSAYHTLHCSFYIFRCRVVQSCMCIFAKQVNQIFIYIYI